MEKYLSSNEFGCQSELRISYINNFDAVDTYWKKYVAYFNKMECFIKRYFLLQREAENFKKKLLSHSCDVSIVFHKYLFLISYLNKY